MRLMTAAAFVILAPAIGAQTTDSTATPKVQDNSFLVEEAYNQEAGVVQHISTYRVNRGSSDFEFGFAQEWPLRSIRHQLSYDIPVVRAGTHTGIGDIAVNYRYQLVGDGDARVAIAPRISAFLPTGDWKRGRGAGAAGGEIGIALSFVPSSLVAFHSNAGVSVTPRARDLTGDRHRTHEVAFAQSAIFTRSNFIQPLIEAVYADGSEGDEFLVSPGLRAAFNFPSGLQIVPGIAVPLGVGPSSGARGVFVYLSFEHPFKR